MRSTVVPIPPEDFELASVRAQINTFTMGVNDKIGNYKHPRYNPTKKDEIYYTAFDSSPDDDDLYTPYFQDHPVTSNDLPITKSPVDLGDHMDPYIGTNVVVPGQDGTQPVLAKVHKRK